MRITSIKTMDKGRDELRRGAKPRVYFFIKDETVLENLENRHSRPYNEYRRLLPSVWSQLGVKEPGKLEARWSQKAGCTCGCSPGFVIDGWDEAIHHRDVFVDVGA